MPYFEITIPLTGSLVIIAEADTLEEAQRSVADFGNRKIIEPILPGERYEGIIENIMENIHVPTLAVESLDVLCRQVKVQSYDDDDGFFARRDARNRDFVRRWEKR